MAKAPKKQPEEGDKVRLKGRGHTGTLKELHWANNWCFVDWDNAADPGPKIVHRHELEIVS